MSECKIKTLEPTLLEAAEQYEQWKYVDGKHAKETELYWAKKVLDLAIKAVSSAQEKYENKT